MSTIEEFENAPLGATATHPDGRLAVGTFDYDGARWYATDHNWYTDGNISLQGFTLDPVPAPAPTTASEALDLAWNLGHPVKEWQVIPKGTRYLERHNFGLIKECTADRLTALSDGLRKSVRTHEPLAEPDWLDAPAVLATCGYCETETEGPQVTLHGLLACGNHWECAECQTTTTWRELTDVTPLYPVKES